MIVFRMTLLMMAVYGIAVPAVGICFIRDWSTIITGSLLPINAVLFAINWTEILYWWRLKIMMPALEHEASLAAHNFRNHRTPFQEITLWKES